ncbi:MAG: hypothetical protein U0527_12655 [Candidatus Eisenbacteria bacterium]
MSSSGFTAWGSIRPAGASILAGLVALALAGSSQAGGWTRERGTFYSRTAANRYQADREFDGRGDRRDLALEGEFRDLNLSTYFEYGLTDRLTAIAATSIKSIRSENLVKVVETKGLSDVELALRTALARGTYGVTAVQALVKIPSGYDPKVELPIGNGEGELDLRGQYGRSLWPVIPGYCGLEVGYRFRGGKPANELRYLAECGSDLGGGSYVRAKLDGIRGQRTETIYDSNLNPTLRGSSDVGALDLTAGLKLGTRLAVEAGYTTALYGRTTTAGSTVNVALAWTGRIGSAR